MSKLEQERQIATVLIVDDDLSVRVLTRRMLAETYRVLQAETVEQALELVAHDTIDLVLLDVVMAGTNGFEGCRRIKAGAKGYLPVLLLSGLVAHEALMTGLEAGADDFLNKPISQSELSLRVAAFIKIRVQGLLIQKQLRELRELVVLKDDLVDLLVHDLRSPLTAVTCSFRILEAKATEPEMQEDIRIGIAATQQVLSLAEDLLSVRLLESGALAPALTLCSPLEVVEAAVASLRTLAIQSGVKVSVNGPKDLRVRLDRKLVVRAVENLLGNAVKYTRDGVELSVTAEGEGAVIDVADRGSGIPDAFKPGLFEKFGSVEARSGSTRCGVGLGLYMVRMVAMAHGGNVSVADRVGGGAQFRLTLSGQEQTQ
ncbi:MAG: hybrid sensor histidine kinase/response regulator [Archangium sp.]|nr:hybrid sensor histidine kinase/response regulator [Archangium sp.]MDP3570535.1 hybrid sensor histidine kinase/response regulator [Archangium sp.]